MNFPYHSAHHLLSSLYFRVDPLSIYLVGHQRVWVSHLKIWNFSHYRLTKRKESLSTRSSFCVDTAKLWGLVRNNKNEIRRFVQRKKPSKRERERGRYLSESTPPPPHTHTPPPFLIDELEFRIFTLRCMVS